MELSEIAKAPQACQIPLTPCSKRIAKGLFVEVQRAAARRTASREARTLTEEDATFEEDSVAAAHFVQNVALQARTLPQRLQTTNVSSGSTSVTRIEPSGISR